MEHFNQATQSIDVFFFDTLVQDELTHLKSVASDFEAGVCDLRTLLEEENAILHCATSMGKDSSVVTLMAVEAYRQSIQAGTIEAERPLILSTINTGGEAIPMVFFVNYAKKRLEAYAKEHGINLIYDIVQPPIHDQFYVKYASASKLIANPTRHGDCSIILKLDPSQRYLRSMLSKMADYSNAKVISCVGSRTAESSRRSGNMKKQGIAKKGLKEIRTELEESTIGGKALLKYAPIKDWSTDSVFDLLRIAGSRPIRKVPGYEIPAFLPDFGLLLAIYGNGSSETCEIAVGSTASSGCNGKSRFGCVFCTLVSVKDHSSSALAEKTRWNILGASNALRVRDYLFRLSTDIDARSLHARAYDPTAYNRVALQPNVLRVKHLEKMVRLASQLTVDSIKIAADFRQLMAEGRENEHPGIQDILSDHSLAPKTKAAFVEMYKEGLQDPASMYTLFSLEHAILLSYRWSLEGVAAAPFRPLAIWKQIEAGKGRIPYPKLNTEYEELHGPLSLTNSKPLPEAVMMPILKVEDPISFVENPVSLQSLWVRPTDISDMMDSDSNCSVTNQAKHFAEVTVKYNQGFKLDIIPVEKSYSELDVIFSSASGNLKAIRVHPTAVAIESVKLEGKTIKGRAAEQLLETGLAGEMEDAFNTKLAAFCRRIQAEEFTGEDAAVLNDLNERLTKEFASGMQVQRMVKHLRNETRFAGYSDQKRQVKQVNRFTRRVVKVQKGKIVKGNTRLGFYALQVDSKQHLELKQEVSMLLPDFGIQSVKFIGTHDDSFNEAFEATQNLKAPADAIQRWVMTGGLDKALDQHNDFMGRLIKHRKIRRLKSNQVRQYGGTHVAESLMAEGVISVEKEYWAQLKAILRRTHIFNELGLFQFQSWKVDDIQSHKGAISMAQHRADKAKVVAVIRKKRNEQRRLMKSGVSTISAASDNLSVLKSACLQAINIMTDDINAELFKITFNTGEVAVKTKAEVASLFLSLNFDGSNKLDDILSLTMPQVQLTALKASPAHYLSYSKQVIGAMAELEISIEDKLSSWQPLLTAVTQVIISADSDRLAAFKSAVEQHTPETVTNDQMLKYYRPNPAGLSDYLTSAIDTTEKYREQLQDMQNQLSKFRQLALKELAQNMTLSQKLAVLNQRNAA